MKLFFIPIAFTLRLVAVGGILFQFALPCRGETDTTASAAMTSQSLPADFDKKMSGFIREEKFDEAARFIARQETLTPDDPDLAVAKANLNLQMPENQSRIVLNRLEGKRENTG